MKTSKRTFYVLLDNRDEAPRLLRELETILHPLLRKTVEDYPLLVELMQGIRDELSED